MTFLLDFLSELLCPFLSLSKVLFRGLEDDTHIIKRNTNTRLELKETTLDVLDTFTRPAIRAKASSKETTVDDGIDASDDIPHRRKSLTNKSRRANEDTLSLTNGFHDLIERSINDVVELYIHAILLESLGDGLGESLSELISSSVGNDDERIAWTRGRSRPVAIEVEVELKVLTKDRAVAAADGFKLYSLELLKTVEHMLLEGAEDAVKVVLVGAQHVLLHLGILGDLIVEDERIAVVSTKEVASDDGLDLRDVSDHGIRPVKEGADDELESVATDVNGSTLLVDDKGLGELAIADEFDVADGSICTNDGSVRIALHQQGKSAAVVRLSVIQNHVVNLLVTLEDSLNPLLKLSEVGFLDSFEEDISLLTLKKETVVGSTEGSGHDNVKVTQFRMKSTNPVQILLNNKSFVFSSHIQSL